MVEGPAGGAGAGERTEGASVYDRIRTPIGRRSLRHLPSLTRDTLRLVWQAGHRPLLVIVGAQVASAVASAGQLLIAREILDVLTADGDIRFAELVWPLVGLLVALAVTSGAATVLREQSTLLTELVSRDSADRILDVACTVDLEAYETPTFHDSLDRARLNAQTRPLAAVNGLVNAIGGAAGALAVAVALIAIEPLLVPLAAVAVVPLWRASTRNSVDFYRFTVDVTARDRERSYLLNVLTNKDLAKEVRAFDTAPYLRERHDRLYAARIAELRAVLRSRVRRALVGSLLGSAVAAAAVAVLAWLLVEDRMDVANAAVALLGLVQLGQRLRGVVAGAGTLYEASLFVEDMLTFLELRPEVEAARPRQPAPSTEGRLVVEDVTFTYAGASRPALAGVSLEIGPGEIVALVGENGSGKTTLAKLLAFLYRPDSGRIVWSGVDTADCDPRSLRESIAVVFQDFGRYWLSAHDNVALGAIGRSDDREAVVRAAVAGGADPFLRSLPDGYDTVLSRLFAGGRDLSLGQWQRIALSRAMFRDAALVVMDEPTASLDARAEHALFDDMRATFEGRSVLLISHRFSTVRNADRIYVVHDGQVTESGTHASLLAAGGRYAQLFGLQAASYLEDAGGTAGGAAGGSGNGSGGAAVTLGGD